MKKLEELGISPAPWKCILYHNHKNGEYIHLGEVKFADGRKLCYDIPQPNARLVAPHRNCTRRCVRRSRTSITVVPQPQTKGARCAISASSQAGRRHSPRRREKVR